MDFIWKIFGLKKKQNRNKCINLYYSNEIIYFVSNNTSKCGLSFVGNVSAFCSINDFEIMFNNIEKSFSECQDNVDDSLITMKGLEVSQSLGFKSMVAAQKKLHCILISKSINGYILADMLKSRSGGYEHLPSLNVSDEVSLVSEIKKIIVAHAVGVTSPQSDPSTECHTGLASNHEQNPAGIPPSPSEPSSRDPQKP